MDRRYRTTVEHGANAVQPRKQYDECTTKDRRAERTTDYIVNTEVNVHNRRFTMCAIETGRSQ
ncbi:hypothetical protein SARC_17972, partial [Sphaeroforma arctica JP610]